MSEQKRYEVHFYDSFDGWCQGSDFESDDLEESKKHCDKEMKTLDKNNKSMGEHYGVIDTFSDREVYCTMHR